MFDFQKVLTGDNMERWSLAVGSQERAITKVLKKLKRDSPWSRS